MAFLPIETERLLLRPALLDDAEALAERRSDPAVAALQSWEAPYPLDRAIELMTALGEQDDLEDGEWWMLTVADRSTEAIMGDLAIHPTFGLRSIEIGYTFHPNYWGQGYAVEAVNGLIDRLFERPDVSRISAMLHPDNVASAQVLERSGFQLEGHTKLSYWVGEDNSDDLLYGLTREMRTAWLRRPRHRPENVRLIEVTNSNSLAVSELATHPSQERFVGTVLDSFRLALFPKPALHPPEIWMRAIEVDGEVAGFVMLTLASPTSIAAEEPYLWRLLIDRRHQRRGIGARVVELVIEQCRARGAASVRVCFSEERGGPGPLYRSFGFEPTGLIHDGETEARLHLT